VHRHRACARENQTTVAGYRDARIENSRFNGAQLTQVGAVQAGGVHATLCGDRYQGMLLRKLRHITERSRPVMCDNWIALFCWSFTDRTQESANALASRRSGRAMVAERA
jgi:hypothetical protein